jgi:hypothetical protein
MDDSEAVAIPSACKSEVPKCWEDAVFFDMIRVWEPTVNNVIGFMDGLGLTTECTDERITQNVYYCGYGCNTMVNNVLVFGLDG